MEATEPGDIEAAIFERRILRNSQGVLVDVMTEQNLDLWREWEQSAREGRKCIRLDTLILAIHLAVARGSLVTYSGIYRAKVTALKRTIAVSGVASVVGVWVNVLGRFITWLNAVGTAFESQEIQKSLEDGIRRGFVRTGRELALEGLKKDRGKGRKKRNVLTRSRTKKQRKKNKIWVSASKKR